MTFFSALATALQGSPLFLTLLTRVSRRLAPLCPPICLTDNEWTPS